MALPQRKSKGNRSSEKRLEAERNVTPRRFRYRRGRNTALIEALKEFSASNLNYRKP